MRLEREFNRTARLVSKSTEHFIHKWWRIAGLDVNACIQYGYREIDTFILAISANFDAVVSQQTRDIDTTLG